MLLAPSALWWLLAAAPIAAIFLFRRRIVEVRVPALVFWEHTRRKDTFGRWGRRMRRWAGLALHLLVLMLLTAALTEPINPAYQHELLIVLDDSATMRTVEDDGRPRAAHAAERLLDKLRQAPGGVQTTIFLAGAPPRILIERETVAHKVQAALGTHASRDVNPDFEQALSLARRHRQQPETPILVISDRLPKDLAAQSDVEWIRVGRPQPNLAVTDVRVSADGAAFDVVLRHRGMSPRTATISLISNQQTLANVPIMLQESPTTVRIPAELRPGDLFKIHAEPADAFELDNVWFGVCPPDRQTHVRLVTTGNDYLVAALDQPGTQLDVVAPSDWNASAAADVTVLDVPTAGPGRSVPGRFIVFGGTDPFGVCLSDTPFIDTTPLLWAADHPLARDVDFLSWRIRRTAGLFPSTETQTIVATADAPLVFTVRKAGAEEKPENTFEAVYVNFSLMDSNVGLLAGFPVFLWNTIDDLLGRRAEDYLTAQPTGRPLIFPAVAGVTSATVLDPREREMQAYFDGARLLLPFPEHAGFYRLNFSDVAWIRAVNYRADTDFEEEVQLSPAPENRRSTVPHWWRALPPWGMLAALAGALVLLEALLFHRGWLKIG